MPLIKEVAECERGSLQTIDGHTLGTTSAVPVYFFLCTPKVLLLSIKNRFLTYLGYFLPVYHFPLTKLKRKLAILFLAALE